MKTLRFRNWLKSIFEWARRVPVAAAACLVLLAGCHTPPPRQLVQDALPYIPSITAAVGTVALQLAIEDPVERKSVSDSMYAIALGIRSLMGGVAPTEKQIQDAVTSFGGSKTRYAALGEALAGVWAGFYPQVARGDTKLAFSVLESIAVGVETCAKRFGSTI